MIRRPNTGLSVSILRVGCGATEQSWSPLASEAVFGVAEPVPYDRFTGAKAKAFEARLAKPRGAH
ncbi:MAG TPA: hypothetical protein PKA59_11285 [Chakrabartia sp.]|jgi:hypothetical protein|nr:hypothetical protein [Chakrabartia sp.]